jgi:hypothetical protein
MPETPPIVVYPPIPPKPKQTLTQTVSKQESRLSKDIAEIFTRKDIQHKEWEYNKVARLLFGSDERNVDLESRLKRLHESLPPIPPITKAKKQEKEEINVDERQIVTGYRCITSHQPKVKVPTPPRQKIPKSVPVTPSLAPKMLNIKSRVLLEKLQTVPIDRLLKIQYQYEFYAQQQKQFELNRVKVTRARVDGIVC